MAEDRDPEYESEEEALPLELLRASFHPLLV